MAHIDNNSLKHFGVCFAMTAVGGLIGLGAAVACSILKEVYDLKTGGHLCWWDLFFDFMGMACGLALHLCVLWLIATCACQSACVIA